MDKPGHWAREGETETEWRYKNDPISAIYQIKMIYNRSRSEDRDILRCRTKSCADWKQFLYRYNVSLYSELYGFINFYQVFL